MRVEQESVRRMRWRARAPRYCALGAITVLTLAGARTTIFGTPPPKIERYYQTPAIDIGLEAFAADYARAYLSWNPLDMEAHQQVLERFNPRLASESSFQPSRQRETVTNTEVVQDEPSALGGRIVTVEVTVTPGDRTEYLAVPVARDNAGAMTVSNFPSFVGPPSTQNSPPTPAAATVEDQELVTVVERALTNYLAGDANDLGADLAPSAQVTYPPNPLQVIGSPGSLTWAAPGTVLITVQAQDQQGATYTLTYEVGVQRTQRWYVNSIAVFPNQ
ncbi:MAG: conjugal transfer protein [Solirubrobacteraceae bacterium]